MREKALAEFTKVLKSFEEILRKVRGKSLAEFTKVLKYVEETLRQVRGKLLVESNIGVVGASGPGWHMSHWCTNYLQRG